MVFSICESILQILFILLSYEVLYMCNPISLIFWRFQKRFTYYNSAIRINTHWVFRNMFATFGTYWFISFEDNRMLTKYYVFTVIFICKKKIIFIKTTPFCYYNTATMCESWNNIMIWMTQESGVCLKRNGV